MPRREYQQALADLRADVRAMGESVLDQLDRGLVALERREEAPAREAIEGDHGINERYLELEADCIDLFALQQPVAGDLRFVAASFKILTDLERIGDLATNLGEYAIAAEDGAITDPDVGGIGRDAHGLVEDALDAYADGDAGACHGIAARDDEIDALCSAANERVVRELIEEEAGGDAWRVERVIDDVSRVLLTIRDVERVADHGVNVAARTLYMIENDPELIY